MDTETRKVFNYILHQGGCVSFKDLQKHPSPLEKFSEQVAEEWLVSREKEEQHFKLDRRQNGELISVRLHFKTRLCVRYQESGSCKVPRGEQCGYGCWHICKDFVEGSCKDDKKCQLSHDFRDQQNSRKISEFGFEKLPNAIVRKVIANCLPHICQYYLEKKCRLKQKCPNLHVCPNYVKNFSCVGGECGFKSHTIEDPHSKEVLSKFGLSPHIKPIKIVLVNILLGKGVQYCLPQGVKHLEGGAGLHSKLNNLEAAAGSQKFKASVHEEKKPQFRKGQDKHGKQQGDDGYTTKLNNLNISSDLQDAQSHRSLTASHHVRKQQDCCQEGFGKPSFKQFEKSRPDQSYLQLRQQMSQPNFNRDIPSLLPTPSLPWGNVSSHDKQSHSRLKAAFSVDSLFKPTNTGTLGQAEAISRNSVLSQGLELNQAQREMRGRGNFRRQPANLGESKGRGKGRGNILGQRQEQYFEENKIAMQEQNLDSTKMRGGMRGRGRGQSRNRGAAKREVRQRDQLHKEGKVEEHGEPSCEEPSYLSAADEKLVNEPEEKVLNTPGCQEQKKKKRRQKQRKPKQSVDDSGKETEDKSENKQLIDFSDESESDDTSKPLIDLSTGLSQDLQPFNLSSPSDQNFEDFLTGENAFSQDSAHSLSQYDLFNFESLPVLDEVPLSSQTESKLPSQQSQSAVTANISLEKSVFDILCIEYSCIASFSEIASRKDLFPQSITDTASWFRKHSSSFQVVENERGEIDFVSAFSRTARLCFRYNVSSGNCTHKNCSYFHVCNEMVATGFCSFGATCTMNHDLKDKHNKSIIRRLKLNNLNDEQLCALMRMSAPQVCLEYNMAGCSRMDSCNKVHICKDFVRGKCSDSDDCDLSHEESLDNPHTHTVLDKLKMPSEKITPKMLIQMLLICEDPDEARAAAVLCSAPHVFDDPSIDICDRFVLGKCRKGRNCSHHHCPMPYQWQYQNAQGNGWENFPEETNEDLERLYCDVNVDELASSHLRNLPSAIPRLQPGSDAIKVNFSKMCTGNDFVSIRIRRLSTESFASASVLTATKWVWYWLGDDKSWKEYGYGDMHETNVQQKEIEASFLRRDKFYSFSTAQHSYRLFFQDPMYQQNMNPKFYTRRNVKRRPFFISREDVMRNKRTPMRKVEKSKPVVRTGCWKTIPEGQEFIRVPLSPGSLEFKDVQCLFYQAMSTDRAVITKVERVQNKKTWDIYEGKKSIMAARTKSSGVAPEERLLFHSTSESTVDRMCAQNIDRSFYSNNATAFGHGVYFASQASFTDRHCSKKSTSTRQVFLATVLVGSYTEGEPSMHSLTDLETNNGTFDSCVDDVQKPAIFVVFDKSQYYPAYLIEYSSTTADTEMVEGETADQNEGCSLM